MNKQTIGLLVSGVLAGMVNGLFGAGGGMVLIPLLLWLTDLKEEEIFPSSVWVILPICLVSLLTQFGLRLPYKEALPYLLGSIPGGIFAGIWGQKIPVIWLHRILGVLILYGGIRYLC